MQRGREEGLKGFPGPAFHTSLRCPEASLRTPQCALCKTLPAPAHSEVRRRIMKRASCLLIIALLGTCMVFAQQGSNGSISGTVTDPSGQAVPNAKVKVVSEL